jgi:hypothetical protein
VRIVLIIVGVLVLLKICLTIAAQIRGGRDSDVVVEPRGNGIVLRHSGATLEDVALTINGRHRVELGNVVAGERVVSAETISTASSGAYAGEPIQQIDVAARREGRPVHMHYMYVTAHSWHGGRKTPEDRQ